MDRSLVDMYCHMYTISSSWHRAQKLGEVSSLTKLLRIQQASFGEGKLLYTDTKEAISQHWGATNRPHIALFELTEVHVKEVKYWPMDSYASPKYKTEQEELLLHVAGKAVEDILAYTNQWLADQLKAGRVFKLLGLPDKESSDE